MPQRNFELLKKSDPAALEKIHAQYNRKIFWVGKRIINDDFVVENLVQDAFLKLWDYRDKISNPLHIVFFLQYVMKLSCYAHYSKPRNKFFRTVASLESFQNYQEYLAGYDPADTIRNLSDQDTQQRFFDVVQTVLPLIKPERRQLIDLCLKYGFCYKDIAQVMGKGIRETVNEVNRAIADIKKIVDGRTMLERKQKTVEPEPVHERLSPTQTQVLQLRCKMNRSFAAIAQELNLSQKEVHEEFMVAYKFTQQQQQIHSL